MAGPLPLHDDEPTPAPTESDGSPASTTAEARELAVAMNRTNKQNDQSRNVRRNGRHSPVCPFCFSADTMEPFRRSPHVTLLSRIIPRLRWRYCRSCTRHFLSMVPR